MATAITAPMTMPSSTEMLAMKPLANLAISRMDTSTTAEMPTPVRSAYLGLGTVGTTAKPLGTGGSDEPGAPATDCISLSHLMCSGFTTLGAVGPTGLPKIQLMPTRIRLMPMTAMMVPVTTGGKNRSMRLTSGAIRIEITPCADHRTKNQPGPGGAPCALRHGHHGRHRGKGHAHHHRQPDAEPLRGAQRLDQRDEPADEQVGRDQLGHLVGREVERAADDERHGHRAGIHHQHMLQAQRREAPQGQVFVHGMHGRGHGNSFCTGPEGWVAICVQCGAQQSIQKSYTKYAKRLIPVNPRSSGNALQRAGRWKG